MRATKHLKTTHYLVKDFLRKQFEGTPTNVTKRSKTFTYSKALSEENQSEYKTSQPLCSSESESDNFSNNNIDSDN